MNGGLGFVGWCSAPVPPPAHRSSPSCCGGTLSQTDSLFSPSVSVQPSRLDCTTFATNRTRSRVPRLLFRLHMACSHWYISRYFSCYGSQRFRVMPMAMAGRQERITRSYHSSCRGNHVSLGDTSGARAYVSHLSRTLETLHHSSSSVPEELLWLLSDCVRLTRGPTQIYNTPSTFHPDPPLVF